MSPPGDRADQGGARAAGGGGRPARGRSSESRRSALATVGPFHTMSKVAEVPSLAGSSLLGAALDGRGLRRRPVPGEPAPASSSQVRPSEDSASAVSDDDLYAVPESDTADFVGIGSLGHIIRKCFKEIYYPGQTEDLPGVGGGSSVGESAAAGDSLASAPTFKALSESELDSLDEEARRAYDEEKAAFEQANAAAAEAEADAEAAPEDGDEAADAADAEDAADNAEGGEPPITTRSTDIESARADGSAIANGQGASWCRRHGCRCQLPQCPSQSPLNLRFRSPHCSRS